MGVTSNELLDLMREYGVKVEMLGTEEEPSPNSLAIGDMLLEIHGLRAKVAELAMGLEASLRVTFPEGFELVDLSKKSGGMYGATVVSRERGEIGDHGWFYSGMHGRWEDALKDVGELVEEAMSHE